MKIALIKETTAHFENNQTKLIPKSLHDILLSPPVTFTFKENTIVQNHEQKIKEM